MSKIPLICKKSILRILTPPSFNLVQVVRAHQRQCSLNFYLPFKHTSYLQNCINMSSSDYLLSWLPLYHDMGLIAATLYPLFQGKKFHMMSPFDWIQTPHYSYLMVRKLVLPMPGCLTLHLSFYLRGVKILSVI